MNVQNGLVHVFPTRNSSLVAPANIGSEAPLITGGGPTMHSPVIYAIFWKPSGYTFEGFGGSDSRYESLITRFFTDISASSYYNIVTQYPDAQHGTPLVTPTFGGLYTDTTTSFPNGAVLQSSDIQKEILSAISVNNWPIGPNSVFFLFPAGGVTTPGFVTDFCAYHGDFSSGAQKVIYAMMPDFNTVNGFSSCGDGWNILGLHVTPNGDASADAEINVVSHELFESVTDPYPNTSWNDPTGGGEIGDKCAWNFNNVNVVSLGLFGDLTLNGHNYIVQTEWSNYNNGCVLSYGPTTPVVIQPSPSSGSSLGTFKITYSAQNSSWFTTSSASSPSTLIFVDRNTLVTAYSNLTNTEGWCFASNCPGVIVNAGSGGSVALTYFDLLPESASALVVDGGSPSIALSYTTAPSNINGAPQTIFSVLSSQPQTILGLRGTSASIAGVVAGSSGERWITTAPTFWTLTTANQIPPLTYYHQFDFTASYSVNGAGNPSSPSISFTSLGAPASSILTNTPTSLWVDGGTTWNIGSVLGGSTATERWDSSGAILGSATGALSVSPVFYHQFLENSLYSIAGGGSGFSAPVLSATQFGSPVSITLTTSATAEWIDAGSSWKLPATLAGSSNVERWTSVTSSGVTSSSGVIMPTYYHQFQVQVSYNVIGQGNPSPPDFQFYSYGASSSVLLTTPGQTLWVDSNTYSATDPLGGSTSTERWFSNVAAGTLGSPGAIVLSYNHQYLISVTGALSNSQWFNAGASATISEPGVFNRSSGTGTRTAAYIIDGGQPVSVLPTSGNVTLAIVANSPHTIVFQTVPQFQVTLDGGSLQSLASVTAPTIPGDNYWYDSGSSVNVVLNGVWGRASGTGSRLVSYGIEGGSQSPVATIGIVKALSISAISSPESVVTVTATQFFIDTSAGSLKSITNPSISNDAGWYDAGTSVSATYNYIWNVDANQSRSNALADSVDGGPRAVLARQGSGAFTVSVTMDKAHEIGIDSVTQYSLVVSGGSGTVVSTSSPTNDAYFDAGSILTVATPYTWGTVNGNTRQNLVSYSLDGETTNVNRTDSGTFTTPKIAFNGPQRLAFSAIAQYLVSFQFKDHSGTTVITPSSLQLEITSIGVRNVTGLQIWLDNGSMFQLSQVEWEHTDVKPTSQTQFLANSPLNETITANVFSGKLLATDYLGLPISGAHVVVTLANGTSIASTTGSNGSVALGLIPLGKFSASVSYLGETTQINGDASAQAVTHTTMLSSYPTFGVILGILVVLALAGFALLRRTKSSKAPVVNHSLV